MRQEDYYQIAVIGISLLATTLFGVFLYRELYPEYRIYQNNYVALEEFRSSYSGEPLPPFKFGVKQIVIPKSDKGPETIDRCISCHVALQFEHFSPTQVAKNVNGDVLFDSKGFPKQMPNPNYIWGKLDQKILDLRAQGKEREAADLEALKTAKVGEHTYDVEKVLQMHPLIGLETRPFEFHPLDEYGCVVCHGGNGRGLVTDRAHGPVFDGTYEESYMGPEPEFLEVDPAHDPAFARAYNHKPGERLLFQTSPLLVGNLIQSRCVQCHKPTSAALEDSFTRVGRLTALRQSQIDLLSKSFEQEYNALVSLLSMRKFLAEKGVKGTMEEYRKKTEDLTLPQETVKSIQGNIDYLGRLIVAYQGDAKIEQNVQSSINADLLSLLGSQTTVVEVQTAFDQNPDLSVEQLQTLLTKHSKEPVLGSLQRKAEALANRRELDAKIDTLRYPLVSASRDKAVVRGLESSIDTLTTSFQRGEELFFSQACYACHKIAGLARGGVGPELTNEGHVYPWFIKESIVWPQADLKTSTMPNFHMDHQEVEDLMTFLLAQRNDGAARSDMDKKIAIAEWEKGKKNKWEREVSPADIRNVRNSMTLFASEGCAACHRLRGFESDVGFTVEKEKPGFDRLYAERQWFANLFPEEIPGSELVATIEKNWDELNKRISVDVRSGSILEEIEKNFPDLIPSFYTNFRYAARAKNDTDDSAKWEEQVRKVLMVYIQEYGLGRLIGPRPNWSGIYRTDQWLMEHFWNPSSLVARSIMPVFPFDNTKFLALIHMLNHLAEKNRNAVREVWDKRGFNPALAFEYFCSQCHGDNLRGNGPVAEWIYPIPKNLANPIFLRNLTKERAIYSVVHGIAGGPMPPWGEAAAGKDFENKEPMLSKEEATQLVEWIYRNLPGERFIREAEEVRKWEYTPEDVIKDLKDSGEKLEGEKDPLSFLPKGEEYLASLTPVAAISGLSVQDVFDVVPNPYEGPDKSEYFIKKKYYTRENLAAGKAFFELNCAICHGNDADGAGLRAGVMEDAKPRMLINLPWLETRDDLRLIRSIIYGVQGTSMIPWGDQTTSLQRLQLVMYIRSLTQTKKDYAEIKNLLFEVFQPSLWAVQDARAEGTGKIRTLLEATYNMKINRYKLEEAAKKGIASPDEVSSLLVQELQKEKELNGLQQQDQSLSEMRSLVMKEQELYKSLGDHIFSLYGESKILAEFLQILELNRNTISFKDGRLTFTPISPDKIAAMEKQITEAIEKNTGDLENRREVLKGKMKSPALVEEMKEVSQLIEKNKLLRKEIVQTFSELGRTQKNQQKLYQTYETSLEKNGQAST